MSDPGRTASIYDVAQRAQVSHQTVSRVINGFEGIRPATRERVMAAIEELGFRRSGAARALATQRTFTIGVLAPEDQNFGPASSVHWVERAARERGYRIVATSSSDGEEDVRASLDFLLGSDVEGVVVVTPQRSAGAGALGTIAGRPAITLQGGVASGDAVFVDQLAGARMLVDHLVGLGHRHIELLSGPEEYVETALRRDGVLTALRAHGVQLAGELHGDWTAASGYAAAAQLSPGSTAVIGGNDQMAMGLIRALSDAGRAVPGEVSVTGFDDIPEAAYLLPALTTVRQDFAALGRRAVDALIGRIEGEEATPIAPIPAELVVRGSTAGPAIRADPA